MIVKEYRIPLPLTVDEYQIAQLHSVAEASMEETGGGDGIEVVKNEPMVHEKYGPCQYTLKIYHLESKVPGFIRMIAPKGSLELREEAWNAYPYCRTVLTNPGYMKDGFQICIETWHKPGQVGVPPEENSHGLDKAALAKREVVNIDIIDPVDAKDYKPEMDPTKFKSEKTGRGPLSAGWQSKAEPLMWCYKLVTCEFKWFGLQGRVENLIHKTDKRLFHNFHRQVFCSMDKWHGMTMDDIRKFEDEIKHKLDEKRAHGPKAGIVMDE